MEGHIKRLINDKGFGFIRTKDGQEYFFHQTSLRNSAFTDLREGMVCSFEAAQSSKGPRAEDVVIADK